MPTESRAHTGMLWIVGAGGHGKVVADAALALGWSHLLVTDDDLTKAGHPWFADVPVVAQGDARLCQATHIHVAMGHNAVREHILSRDGGGLPWLTLVHPAATVSAHARVGAGSLVAARSVVAPHALVGTGCIVNHGAVVDHDASVGDFAHIGPNATLSGRVWVGARCLIGSGAHVLPGVRIADDVVVGAGSVVTADLPEPGTYVGTPARRIA